MKIIYEIVNDLKNEERNGLQKIFTIKDYELHSQKHNKNLAAWANGTIIKMVKEEVN